MSPSDVLRGVADALDRDDMDLRMTHPVDAPEAFKFLGDGTIFLGEKDGFRHYYVPAERILKHMAKWLRGIRIEGQNEQSVSRIVIANGSALKS